MPRGALLSRSADQNPLYFAAFGEAAQSEWRNQYCSEAALTLKRKRRALFNQLVKSQEGCKALESRASHSPTFTSTNASTVQEIGFDSDEDDYPYHKRLKTTRRASGKPLQPTTYPTRDPEGLAQSWDDDLFDTSETHPVQLGLGLGLQINIISTSESESSARKGRTCDGHKVSDTPTDSSDSSKEDDEDEKDQENHGLGKGTMEAEFPTTRNINQNVDDTEDEEWSETKESDEELDDFNFDDVDFDNLGYYEDWIQGGEGDDLEPYGENDLFPRIDPDLC